MAGISAQSFSGAWIIRNQFGRRKAFCRAELALKLEPLLKLKAKANQGARNDISQKSVKSEPADTQKTLAKAAHVSHDTIAKTKVIQAKASEETKAALRAARRRQTKRQAFANVGKGFRGDTREEIARAANLSHGTIDLYIFEEVGRPRRWHGGDETLNATNLRQRWPSKRLERSR